MLSFVPAMIVITGAAGFIGSCLAAKLNEEGFNNLVLVDDFSREEKKKNWQSKRRDLVIERNDALARLEEYADEIEFFFHIGARTDTTEFDKGVFDELNVEYSKAVWRFCTRHQIPMAYASSAATYGLGELGYEDDESKIGQLKPLNPYGDSKNDFDKWALSETVKPYFWAGLKFFNVYGPNEYHKGRMASVIFHTFNQIKKTGAMKLFRSHNPDYTDGGQMRDFVYVKDVVAVLYFLMLTRKRSGIYNLGSGTANTFLSLAQHTFRAMGVPESISYIDTPEDIRDKYQYYTKAEMGKLRSIGYDQPFTSLEDGVGEYVKGYLNKSYGIY